MAMYRVATLILLKLVQNTQVSQNLYADDGSAVGRLDDLLLFFKQLTEHGSYFGYNVIAPNFQIIVKEASNIKVLKLVEVTAVEIVEGCCALGSVIVNEKAIENFNVTTAGKFSVC